MAKELLKLLDSIDISLGEIGLSSNMITVSTLIYAHIGRTQQHGSIKFELNDVIAAVKTVNTRLNKVRKLEKRIEALEKKVCSCKPKTKGAKK